MCRFLGELKVRINMSYSLNLKSFQTYLLFLKFWKISSKKWLKPIKPHLKVSIFKRLVLFQRFFNIPVFKRLNYIQSNIKFLYIFIFSTNRKIDKTWQKEGERGVGRRLRPDAKG